MSGIDDYMYWCSEEDEAWERQKWRDELELERLTQQIQYEAEHRGAQMRLGLLPPPSLSRRENS